MVLSLCCFASHVQAQTSYSVHISPSEFLIHPGDTYTDRVHITPVPPAGLYSMSVKITFDGAKSQVASVADIIIPPALNSGPFGGPPDKSTGFGFAGAAVTVPGDFDGNQIVNLIDFARLAALWLQTDCGPCNHCDLNGDHAVGLPDLNIFQRNYPKKAG